MFGAVAGFAAMLGGAAVDPVNYIPWLGPSFRAALMGGKLGRIGGRAIAGAGEAAIGTAILEPAIIARRNRFGDDLGFADAVLDIAVSALFGGGFGAGAGAIARVREIRAVASARAKLNTLAAVDQAVGDLANGRPIDVDPAIAREAAEIGRAYDQVRQQPQGAAADPLVLVRPRDIEEIVLERGGWKGVGDVTVKGSGWGLAKIIWKHGDQSTEPEAFRVTREDVLALPEVVRRYAPYETVDPQTGRIVRHEWIVERDGRKLMYAAARFTATDGRNRVVTIMVPRPDAPGAARPLSQERTGSRSGSPSEGLGPVRDTAGRLGFQQDQSRSAMPASENIGGPAPARNVGEERPVDTTVAADPPPGPELTAAEQRVMAPDRGLEQRAQELGVDARSGAFAELPEFQQLQAEGRVTPEEAAAFKAADETLRRAEDYAKAYDAAAVCLTRNP